MLALLLWAAAWQSAATPHFHVLSTASDDETRAALVTLDATRLRAEQITGWRTRGGPVMVRIAASPDPGYHMAFGRDWIFALPARHQDAALEYARLWLRRSERDLPAWLMEGLARSAAALPVEPVKDPLPLDLLLQTDFRNVPAAQARQFVEYLRATATDRFPVLLESITLHQPAAMAIEWSAGKQLGQMEVALAGFRPKDAPLTPAAPRAERGPATAFDAELATLAAANDSTGLTRRFPNEPGAWVAQAANESDDNRRRAAYEKAWQLGTTDSEAIWQYAAVLEGVPGRADVLERLVQLAPEHWEARLALAREALAKKAPDRARRLLALMPERSAPEAPEFYRLQSHAARLAQNRAEATAAAERMTAIARTDTLRREADELARMARDMAEPVGAKGEQGATLRDTRGGTLGSNPARTGPERPLTYGPKVTESRTLPSVEGRLVRVDCVDGKAQLHIEVNGATRKFWIFTAAQVVVRSRAGSEAEIPCGVLTPPLRVRAEYEERDEPFLVLLEFL